MADIYSPGTHFLFKKGLLPNRTCLSCYALQRLTLLLGSIPFPSHAETVYVSDNLRVGVRAEPNNNLAPHGVVITGMQLEVLDHPGGYIKIRNANGVEGWIKDVYVTQSKPAILELSAMQAKLQALVAKQNTIIKDDSARTMAMADELSKLKSMNSELHQRLSNSSAACLHETVFGDGGYVVIVVLLGTGGIIAGGMWYRKRAMRRLGGLRL